MASENVSKTVSLKDYIIDMQSAAVKGSAQYEVVLENNTTLSLSGGRQPRTGSW